MLGLCCRLEGRLSATILTSACEGFQDLDDLGFPWLRFLAETGGDGGGVCAGGGLELADHRDFDAIGPMPASGNADDLRDFRKKQNEWYLVALSEALSLTSAQKREVRASLKEWLDRDMDKFAKIYDGSTITGTGIYSGMNFNANQCMRADEFAPWNLCKLSEAQSGLTLEAEWRNEVEAARYIQSNYYRDPTWFARLSVSMKEPVFGSLIAYEPGSTMMMPFTLPGTIPGGMIDISTTFRLTPDQKLSEHLNDLVTQVKILYPAQLRLGLLLNPSLAGSITRAMDKPAPGE